MILLLLLLVIVLLLTVIKNMFTNRSTSDSISVNRVDLDNQDVDELLVMKVREMDGKN